MKNELVELIVYLFWDGWLCVWTLVYAKYLSFCQNFFLTWMWRSKQTLTAVKG